MILTIGGIKGGSGKSTLAANLAVLRAGSGRDVLLVDIDRQCTSSDFTILRNQSLEKGAGYTAIRLEEGAVRTETVRMAEKYDDLIIDAAAGDLRSQRLALTVSDVLLVPLLPRPFDVWALEGTAELVADVRAVNPGLAAYVFVNRGDARGSRNARTMELAADYPALTPVPVALTSRIAYANAAAQGLAVTEVRPPEPKAAAEMEALAAWLETAENPAAARGLRVVGGGKEV